MSSTISSFFQAPPPKFSKRPPHPFRPVPLVPLARATSGTGCPILDTTIPFETPTSSCTKRVPLVFLANTRQAGRRGLDGCAEVEKPHVGIDLHCQFDLAVPR